MMDLTQGILKANLKTMSEEKLHEQLAVIDEMFEKHYDLVEEFKDVWEYLRKRVIEEKERRQKWRLG